MPASVSAVRTVDTCRWDVGGFVSSATRRPVSGAWVRASTLRTGPCAEGTTEDMGFLRSMSPPRCEQNTAVWSSILPRSGATALAAQRRSPTMTKQKAEEARGHPALGFVYQKGTLEMAVTWADSASK